MRKWILAALAVLYVIAIIIHFREARLKEKMDLELNLMLVQNAQNEMNVNDATINNLQSYYSNPLRIWTRNRDKLRAYYILGCAYRDRKESPADIFIWEKAACHADTFNLSCDYTTLAKIYGQLANAYAKLYLPSKQREAIKLYDKYYQRSSLREQSSSRNVDSLIKDRYYKDEKDVRIIVQAHESYYDAKLEHLNKEYNKSYLKVSIISATLFIMCFGSFFVFRTKRERSSKEFPVEIMSYSSEKNESRALMISKWKDFYYNATSNLPVKDEKSLLGSDIVLLLKEICQVRSEKKNGVIKILQPRACDSKEWSRLLEVIKLYHYRFFYFITVIKPLPRLQLKVCILSRLGFYVSDIAVILGTTIQNVSNARSKAVRTLFEMDDTQLLDILLSELS